MSSQPEWKPVPHYAKVMEPVADDHFGFNDALTNVRTIPKAQQFCPQTDSALQFLAGTGVDTECRTVVQYLNFGADDWERQHDIVQWAFPNHVASAYHPHSPVVEIGKVRAHRQLPQAQANMAKLFFNYLSSLSIDLNDQQEFFLTQDKPYWLEQGNHNHLRITRVIIALRIFKLDIIAEKFAKFVLQLRPKFPYAINNTTVEYWYKALHDNLN